MQKHILTLITTMFLLKLKRVNLFDAKTISKDEVRIVSGVYEDENIVIEGGVLLQ